MGGVDLKEREEVAVSTLPRRPVEESIERRRIPTSPAKPPTTPDTVRPTPAIGRAAVRHVRTRVSAAGTVSLVVGVAAVLATLTGLLVPLGVAGGVVAMVFGLIAMARLGRDHVNGYGITTLGLLFGLAATTLGVLAMSGGLDWLSSDADQVARVHAWLGQHLPWITR